MLVRGQHYSIHDILIKKDTVFASIEENPFEFAEYSYQHLGDLKDCIELLINAYQNPTPRSELTQYANRLIKQSETLQVAFLTLQNELALFGQQCNEFKNAEILKTLIYSAVYEDAFSTIEKSTADIQAQINSHTKTVTQTLETIGIEKIQSRLVFCMNMLLQYPYQGVDSVYADIAKLLGQFWYDEGMTLSASKSESDSSSHLEICDQTRENLVALVFFSMSARANAPILENACYIQILEQQLKTKVPKSDQPHLFQLKEYARSNPVAYIQLYDFLFESKHPYSQFIHELFQANHTYVNFKIALLEFYLSIAYQASNQPGFIAIERLASAKSKLLNCLNNKLLDAAVILEESFTEIDVLIELTFFYLEKNSDKGYLLSHKLLQQIKDYKEADFLPVIDKLCLLFKLWIEQSRNADLRHFAISIIERFANQQHALAFSILEECAKKVPDCGVAYADVMIKRHQEFKVNNLQLRTVHDYLSPHAKSNNGKLTYNLFRLKKIIYSIIDFRLLFSSAENQNLQANEALLSYLNSVESTSYRDDICTVLVEELEKNSTFAFQLLYQHYSDIKSLLYLARHSLKYQNFLCQPIIEKIINILTSEASLPITNEALWVDFLHYMLQFSDDNKKQAFALSKLKEYAEASNTQATQILMEHAKKDLSTAVYLTNFLFHQYHNNKSSQLRQLKTILKVHHPDSSPIRNYSLYTLEKFFMTMQLNLLSSACLQEYPTAVSYLCSLIKTSKTDHIVSECKFHRDTQELNSAQGFSFLLNTLVTLAARQGPCQYITSEALISYYFNRKRYQQAENYIETCFNTRRKTFVQSKFFNLIKHSPQLFSARLLVTLEIYPNEIKITPAEPPKVPCNTPPLDLIKSRIKFFSNLNQSPASGMGFFELKSQLKTAIFELPGNYHFTLANKIHDAVNTEQLLKISEEVNQIKKFLSPSMHL